MDFSKFNLLQKFFDWKQYTNQQIDLLDQKMRELEQANERLKQELEINRIHVADMLSCYNLWQHLFPVSKKFVFARRNHVLLALGVDVERHGSDLFCGMTKEEVCDDIVHARFDQVIVRYLDENNHLGKKQKLPQFRDYISQRPEGVKQFIASIAIKSRPESGDLSTDELAKLFFSKSMDLLKQEPDLIDFLALGQSSLLPNLAGTNNSVPLPFKEPANLLTSVPARPKKRSVVFLHNNYYHFNTLAKALNDRDWDAITVSVENPGSAQRQYYFGEDINLYHDDPEIRQKQTSEFLATVPERFGALHFCGQGQASFFPENYDNTADRTKIAWDFLELRRHQTIIGFSPSGCMDGASQSAIRDVSDNVCGRCVWELRPDICSDQKSKAWADTLDTVCDWIGIEGDWVVADRAGPKFVHGPVISTLDPNYWTPELDVPDEMKIDRRPDELLIYHAVGNLKERRVDGRDIKGSTAVEAAVKKLQSEGLPVKLLFLSQKPITEIRYYKVQADIVVDQLNYGRLGANARESFMLGRPVITRLKAKQFAPFKPLGSIEMAPALDANEETVEDVLRQLVLDPEKRKKMSAQSREYALKWFASDVCARRFETIIDRVGKGLPLDTEDLYPPVI